MYGALVVPEVGERGAAGVEGVFLAEGDDLLREWADGLGLGEGGLDAAVLDQADDLIGEQGVAVGLERPSFTVFFWCRMAFG